MKMGIYSERQVLKKEDCFNKYIIEVKHFDTKEIDHDYHNREDFEVTHLTENSILETSETVRENIVNVVKSESSNNSKDIVSDVAHEISTVKENADTRYEIKNEVKEATSDNIDVKINVTMNKLSKVDKNTKKKAKYATYDNQKATINETKNEPTVKLYDTKDKTKFLKESTVDVKFGLLFNELKYNTHADFNKEYSVGSPSTLFNANLSHNFGVGKSYMIKNSTFYDENSFSDDKKYVEVGVYATKVQASPDDDSISSQEDQTMFEYGMSSNEDTDEEDLTPLTFELKKDSEGYLINNKVYLTEFQWNTMVYNSNNDTIYCSLCDELITMPDMCDGHMSSVRHKLNLKKHHPLNKFPDSFIRLIRKQYHCGFCNKLFDKEDMADHLSSRVHDITTEFARNKVTDKIQIKKVHKIGKYTFNMEENVTAEVESDDSWDVYFDDEHERQSNCTGSVTTDSDDDNHTTVSESVDFDASAKDNSLNVVMGADDTAGRDIAVASRCGESDSGHGITSSGNDIVSNSSDVDDNDFVHSGDDNVAISDTDVVTNGTSDVPNSGSNVARSDNDVASSDDNFTRSDNDFPDSSTNDGEGSNTYVANSDNVVAVKSNDKIKSDSGIASSGNVVVVVDGNNKDKKSDKSHDFASNYKDIADKSSDKDNAGNSNNVQTVRQTVISEENESCEIKPSRKFVVTKPKNFVQDFLMIEYKDKKIGLHFHSWHMLIKNSMGSLYCAICKLILPPKEVNSHCKETDHLKKLMSITVVEEFSEYFVRQFDSDFYHCSHCNSMIAQHKMKSHLLTEHSKSGTKAGNMDDQQNTDIYDQDQEVKDSNRKRKRKKKPFTLFTEDENDNETDKNMDSQNQANFNVGGHNQPNYNIGGDNQPNYNIGGHNQPNYTMGGHNQPNYTMGGYNQPTYTMGGHNQTHYNMNDPNHRAYSANHWQAGSSELHYEQMIGDIMVYKFGFLFKLKYLAYNVICRSLNTYFCGLCNQMVADEVALFSHVLSPYHRYCLESTPYVVEFGLHLIRHIRGLFHCTLCNLPVNAYAVFNHTTSELHVGHLAAALGVPAERTVPPVTLLSPCILRTGVPSRPLLPIPPVSFMHLSGISDPNLIQNPYTASYAQSAAGVDSDRGPYNADRTPPLVPPNFERNFNSSNPAQSFYVDSNAASVQNNLPPNASMPQSQSGNVPNTAADNAVDHLSKILLDAHRNCDPALNETRSQQSLTINDPLSQFKKNDEPENPFQGLVSHESRNENTMNCENLAQDILDYTENNAAGQNTALTINNLIITETKPQTNTEVGAHSTVGCEVFEIQNINDTIAYEKLGQDPLDVIKNCDIAQDSKSVESILTLDETVSMKNIKTDGQEISGFKSYKPFNVYDTIAYENLALNLLDQIKNSNVIECAASEQKNIEVGVQNMLDSDSYELQGLFNDCENLAVNHSDRLKNCNTAQNTPVSDDLTLNGMKPEKNIERSTQNTLDSNNYELV